MEKIINVPIDEDTKAALEKRADENGRAASREAAAIIKDAVRPTPGIADESGRGKGNG